MEHRLQTLAKTLYDAANEAERCCEYQKELDELQTSVDALKTENDYLRRKIEDMAVKEKESEAAISKERDCRRNLEQRLKESILELQRIETTRKEPMGSGRLMMRIDSLRRDLQRMADKEKQYQATIEQEKDCNKKLKQRLESLSLQTILRDNIERAKNNDVSDKLRPTTVAEIYQELYDNQWTDAFEILEQLDLQEDKAIERLLQILKHVMEFCKTRSKQQNSQLQQNLLLTEKKIDGEQSDTVPMLLENCKKELSSVTIENLFEMYISKTDGAHDSGVRDILKIQPFVKECIRTCWLCVIQHPPLHIVFESNDHGKPFNTDAYRSYTKTGRHVDYIVWPILLLHENGPVLAKGIAQGTQKVSGGNHLQTKSCTPYRF